MHLERLYASSAMIQEARERDDLRVIAEPSPIGFDGGSFAAPSPDKSTASDGTADK
jgi:hypothetical protein